MLGFRPGSHLHLAVQYDTAKEAKRFVVRAGDTRIQEDSLRRDMNTGEPRALQEFLDWGMQEVLAEHYVLIFSGLGINPRYIRQSLPLETLPEPHQAIRGGQPGDPNDVAYVQQFAEGVERLSPSDLSQYGNAVHQQLFSICHDFSNSGSLAISDLRQVLAGAVQKFSPIKRDPRFDLVLFDTGAAASVEVLFEREGLARVFVGSQGILFDNGSPYTEIFQNWNQLAGKSNESEGDSFSQELALSFMKSTQNESVESQPEFIGVNLETLDEVARVLDTLALALLHSLGDWHVLDALFQSHHENAGMASYLCLRAGLFQQHVFAQKHAVVQRCPFAAVVARQLRVEARGRDLTRSNEGSRRHRVSADSRSVCVARRHRSRLQ